MPKLVMQPSFRAVGQTHAEWQTFENLENKRQNVWQSGMGRMTTIHLCLGSATIPELIHGILEQQQRAYSSTTRTGLTRRSNVKHFRAKKAILLIRNTTRMTKKTFLTRRNSFMAQYTVIVGCQQRHCWSAILICSKSSLGLQFPILSPLMSTKRAHQSVQLFVTSITL